MNESEYMSPVWRDDIFKSKVVFVTGGAGSICSAQTRALVRLGANACIIGRSKDKTETAAQEISTVRKGAKVLGIGECDVRKVENLQVAARRCVEELGGIDFVIAGAAGNFVVPLSDMTSNAFKTVLEIDVMGTFNTFKATIDYLVESAQRNPNPGPSTGGRFLAVSATFHYTGMPLQAHVAAAKASVDALIGSITLEYGPRGVVANVVAPGPINNTEGMLRLAGQSLDGSGRGIPSGRWGAVREIADATVFLFSEASNYVNGHTLVVDGGAWRRPGGSAVGVDDSMTYPDYLLSGQVSRRIKDTRRSKL